MFEWIAQNIGTIIIGLIIAGIVAAIVSKIVRDKRKGKCTSCDCGCGGCSSAGNCGTKES